ncbi:20463_t:CDS:2, partial [Gigaspora margarita]
KIPEERSSASKIYEPLHWKNDTKILSEFIKSDNKLVTDNISFVDKNVETEITIDGRCRKRRRIQLMKPL